jgi:methylglutaconyl-CoA hydratase
MKYRYLEIDYREKHVMTITLNRPEKRNAISLQLIEELHCALDQAEHCEHLRCLTFLANGPAFCTGMDLEEALKPELIEETAHGIAKLLRRVYSFPIPTIAGINGHALAGGAGLACCCDFIVATENFRLGFPELRRGLIPAFVMAILRRQISERYLKEFFLLGEPCDAKRAIQMGLVFSEVSSSELFSKIQDLTAKLMLSAPKATKRTKHFLHSLDPSKLDDQIDLAFALHSKTRTDTEAVEGMTAFLEKRLPSWICEEQ